MSWTVATLDLAWASGFFDGEGSTGTAPKGRANSVGIFASVPQGQATAECTPAVLLRFHRAVGGLGRINNPYFDRRSGTYLFQWRTDNFEEVQAVVALLWAYLGPVKKAQARNALNNFRAHYSGSHVRQRRPETPRRLLLSTVGAACDPAARSIAWAAGLFDGEGSTELHKRWVNHRSYLGLRSKVSQCDRDGIPDVLLRFQAAMSCGWIEGPSSGEGYSNAYNWAAGAAETLGCLEKLWPHLGAVKREQAIAVLRSLELSPMSRRHVWRDSAQGFVSRHSIQEITDSLTA